MTLVSVVDAWVAELTGVGKPLAGATIHKYAPWSMEQLANDGKRHVAIWPTAAQGAPSPLTVGSLPSDLDPAEFAVLVWEDASLEGELRYDDDTANAAWLNLSEAIAARFRVQANTNLGQVGGYTRLGPVQFGQRALRDRQLMAQMLREHDAVVLNSRDHGRIAGSQLALQLQRDGSTFMDPNATDPSRRNGN
jgi:hypothetical protein